ncbi:MAG: MAPEG family protein [Alphaproteobacteria bacterium]|nr:MAPEG family protein [Alphaproteobacteria bacterium]
MSADLKFLVWSAVWCVLLFLPYVLARIQVWGIVDTVGYPENPPPLPAWAQRAQRAHLNMVENLTVFAVLVLVAHVSGAANATTALGATIFFWARIAQGLVHIAGLPWLRTAAFGVSLVGEAMILFQIIAKF